MDLTEQQLMELAADAKLAIVELKQLQKQFMDKVIVYSEVEKWGAKHVATYNLYAKALAKARNMPYKPITLGYFLR